jgi:hypothetical protein
MALPTAASAAVGGSVEVTPMRALALLAATAAATVAPWYVSPAAGAQGAQGAPRGGAFQGAAPAGGSFRAVPASRGGFVHVSSPPRGSVSVHVHRPGVWWGSGGWRGPGPWHGGWWGPPAWSAGWWGPGPWPGAWWGPGVWGGGWWGPGVWVQGGPAVAAPAPVFIERDRPAEPPAPVWWYWCNEANAYYPYVQECPGGWRRVPPQPVPPADRP